MNSIPIIKLLNVFLALFFCSVLFSSNVSGMEPSTNNPPSQVIIVGSQWYGHVPAWIGIERGIFLQNGFDVTWRFVHSSQDRINAISEGEAQFASTGVIAMLETMARGERRFYWVGNQDYAPGFEGLVAHGDIKRIEDLKGKRIGLSFDSSADITCRLLLKMHGLTPMPFTAQKPRAKDDSVVLVNLKLQDIPNAFRSRKVDAAVTWEPGFSQLQKAKGSHILGIDVDVIKKYGFTTSPGPDVLVISAAWVDADTVRAERFLKAYFQAVDWVKNHPDEAAAIVHREYIQQSLIELQRNLKNIVWRSASEQPNILSESGLFRQATFLTKFLYDEGLITGQPDFRRWINKPLINAVSSGSK